MKQLLVLFSTLILFSNCNNSKGWSIAERQKGLKACMDQVEGKIEDATAKKYCSCILDKAMKKYETYADADKGSSEDGTMMGQACMKELQLGGNTGNQEDGLKGEKKDGGIFGGAGGVGEEWSNADVQKFMNTCIQNAMNTGADRQTSTAHCECTLKKIEKKYSSYAEADRNLTKEDVNTIEQECLRNQNQ